MKVDDKFVLLTGRLILQVVYLILRIIMISNASLYNISKQNMTTIEICLKSGQTMLNNTVTKEGQFYILEDFDSIVFVKYLQIFLFLYISCIVVALDANIIKAICLKEDLLIVANILLCFVLSVDIFQVVYYSVSSTILLLKQTVWLNETSAKTLSFLHFFVTNARRVTLLLASVEKFFYCKYPFKHQRYFTKKQLFTSLFFSYLLIFV